MTYLLLQTFLLLLSAYFLGAFLACLVKRFVTNRAELAAARAPRIGATPVAARAVTSVAARPRTIDPVQPKIDILPRPEPKPAPAHTALDTTRFDRALTGPDANAGMPRKMIAEIRPAILKSPTGPAQPFKPKPVAEPVKPAPAPVPAPVQAAVQPIPAPAPAPVQPVTTQPVSARPAAVAPAPAQVPVPAKTPALAPAPAPVSQPVVSSGAAAATAAAAAAAAASAAAVAAAKAAAAATAPRPTPPVAVPAPTITTAPAAKLPDPLRPATPVANASTAPAQQPAVPVLKPAAPEPAATQSAAPQAAMTGDDLQRIRAVDADTERRLHGLGIRRFDDIARWTPADINRVNQALGLTGRIDREQWIEQAQILAKGGETYYSRNRAAAVKGAVPVVAPASPTAPAQASPPGRSVTEMATAAAAAIAAASASVTRGIRPIEPISPMSRANPNLSMPARLSDALKEKEAKASPGATSPPKPAGASMSWGPASDAPGDDLKRIRGVGVLIEKRLNALSVTTYNDIANWTSGDIDRISQTLDFKGRIERENWVEQARILSSGGHTEFSNRVDRGDVESSKDPEAK